MNDSTCSISVCLRKVYFRGKCHAHYVRVGYPQRKQCIIEGCEKLGRCQKMCDMHYTRSRRHGDPETTLRTPHAADLEQRLRFTGWTEVQRRPHMTPCWEWNGGKSPSGYGVVSIGNNKNGVASRVAYQVWVGEFNEDYDMCHKCDNPPCMNPNHLFPGTHLENMQDCNSKKRHAYGERGGTAVLTEQQVTEIIGLYSTGMFSQRELGEQYGVSQTNISMITRGASWKHMRTAA